MRLLVLPISTRRTLIYCEPLASSLPVSEQSYFERAVNRASTTWAGWEKSDTRWKLKVTEYGNKALRRIPFEEWGLKSIPPLKKKQKESLQTILRERETAGNSRAFRENMVEVRFPRSYQALTEESISQVLQRLGSERQKLHKSRLIWSVVGMPFSAPFALLPIIPNFPFLYLAFRAYSHWRALSGSQHLDFLVRNSLLRSSPSSTLDSLYTAGLLHPSREASRKAAEPTEKQTKQVVEVIREQLHGNGSGQDVDPPYLNMAPPMTNTGGTKQRGSEAVRESVQEEIMLLSGWNGKLLAEKLDLPGLEIEIERAVEQVEKDLNKGKVLKEEKESLEKATADGQSKESPAGPKR